MTYAMADGFLRSCGIVSIMTPAERPFIWQITAASRGEVIEVGSAYGGTTILFALAGATRVHSVDNWQCGKQTEFHANLQLAGVRAQVHVHVGTSTECAPRFPDRGFSIVLIDGNHESPWPHDDLLAYAGKVAHAGILLVDDVNDHHPGVMDAVTMWLATGPPFDQVAAFYDEGHVKLTAWKRR